ncbi:MAG TPA: hypothetical protein DHV42_06625 [Lachnospiraceae bacterium]|jgi:hypothetical protein|nr:hypothetical protein [Lachnospiraceae bacterium]
MTQLEKKAALAVAAATAGVIASGVALMKKHARYLTQKAAATFGPDDADDDNSGLTMEVDYGQQESAEEGSKAEPETIPAAEETGK